MVTFRDLPEAITQGDTREAALLEAADCLEEAIAARIDEEMEIPPPSALLSGECAVSVPVQTAMKAALYLAVHAAGISKGLANSSFRQGCRNPASTDGKL